MRWNRHSEVQDKHALLAASKHSWLNYSDEQLAEMVDNFGAAARGTRQHALAKMAIELGQELPHTNQTLNLYVNDCIGFRMDPEVVLYYSPWAFGTADAISFRRDPIEDVMVLRIFDLKTGKNKASVRQLLIYAAYFCLEYSVNPNDIVFDLRFYQHDQIYTVDTDAMEILEIMALTKSVSEMITKRMEEV
jgi:hypothetical protein